MREGTGGETLLLPRDTLTSLRAPLQEYACYSLSKENSLKTKMNRRMVSKQTPRNRLCRLTEVDDPPPGDILTCLMPQTYLNMAQSTCKCHNVTLSLEATRRVKCISLSIIVSWEVSTAGATAQVLVPARPHSSLLLTQIPCLNHSMDNEQAE